MSIPRDGASIPEELLAPVPPAQELRVILPWLFASAGHVDRSSAEYVASELGLSRLQVVDLPRLMLASTCVGTEGPWQIANGVAWVGAKPLPSSAATAAAATLHRLARRCGGALAPPPDIGGTAVILSHRPEDVGVAAEALAIYFHLYCGIEAKVALTAAGAALQCPPPPPAAVEAAVEEFAACARGWLQRVVLEWHYAGGSVEVSGDVVGGWDRTASLMFNVQNRKWRLELWGLPPGIYAFKFIVDGHWCIDLAAPATADVGGNSNNVCLVPACSPGGVGSDAVARAVSASDCMAGTALEGDAEGDQAEEKRLVMAEAARLVTAEERERSARFGALILAYYSKSTMVRRSSVLNGGGRR